MLSTENIEYCKIIIPGIILIFLIYFICNNNFENFELSWGAKSQVPGITQLDYKQLDPIGESRQLPDNNSNLAPNFNLQPSQFSNMQKESIYRQKTGRQAYDIEYFVNKYDSNFGGLLGTQMGLKP